MREKGFLKKAGEFCFILIAGTALLPVGVVIASMMAWLMLLGVALKALRGEDLY